MNIGKVVRDAVGQVAPSVGQALGGPAGGFVGRQVSQVLTGRPDASDDALRLAVAEMTPEQVAALEAMELQQTERERIAAGDRADARDHSEGWIVPAISLLILGGFLGALAAIWLRAPAADSEIIYIMLGVLGTLVTQVANFHLGSTTDSRRKTGLLAGRRG